MRALLYQWTVAFLLLFPAGTLAQGTISNIHGSFTLQTIPTNPMLDSADADFVPNGGPDHLNEQWWWFRLAGDTRETPFHASMAGFSQNYAANIAALTFNQPGVFNGTMRYAVLNSVNFVPGEMRVNASMQIDNVSGAPLTMSVFNYHDFDVFGPNGDSAILESPATMRINDAVVLSHFGRYQAFTPSFFRSGNMASNELGLFDGNVTNFANEGLPFGAGNHSSGFQWDVTISAGGSFVASADFAILSVNSVPEPTSLALGGFTVIVVGCVGYRHRRQRRAALAR